MLPLNLISGILSIPAEEKVNAARDYVDSFEPEDGVVLVVY
jgi:hypothetical protein